MAEHIEVPAPLPHSFRCSCGAMSVGTAFDPAEYADHLAQVAREGVSDER